MADGADPTAASHHVKALAAFTETGRALLELAERESREGRKQFTGTDSQFVLQMYGHAKESGPGGGPSIIRQEHKHTVPH